jgi:hypothetical protein
LIHALSDFLLDNLVMKSKNNSFKKLTSNPKKLKNKKRSIKKSIKNMNQRKKKKFENGRSRWRKKRNVKRLRKPFCERKRDC